MHKAIPLGVIVACVLWGSGCVLVPSGNLPSASAVAYAGTDVAQTVQAVLTQTATEAARLETNTPTSTPTAAVTPTSTITLTPFLGAASDDLACKVLTQSVRNGSHHQARERFNVGWKVRNTGRLGWDAGVVTFEYYGGTKMDLDDVYTLPQTISPGNTVALSASLVSPKRPGGYTTIWALRRGENRFCRVSLTIYVP